MFLTKIPIAPCYCRMMGQTLKEGIRITQYNNPTKAGKYSLEDLSRASDNLGILLRDGCACVARVKLGLHNVRRTHVTDI